MHESSSQYVCGLQANQNISSQRRDKTFFLIQIILILENDVVRFTDNTIVPPVCTRQEKLKNYI